MDGRPTWTGFSLVELTATLAIVAIVLAWGAPVFHHTLLDARRAAAVNAFLHSLFSARSATLRHGEYASVCPSRDLEQCSGQPRAWSEGWIVFINRDRDNPPQVDRGEEVIERHARLANISVRANRDALVFRSDSFTGTTATFVFCDARGGRFARAVIVSQTGRPRLSESDAYGKPLNCD